MPEARPTPGLQLTPEKREQLRRLTEIVEHGTAPVITHEADLAARAFREIERLRAEMERLHDGLLLSESNVDRARAEADNLRHELAVLRRVAEAAETALELLRDPMTRRIDAIAHLERFVADWRRILGG